MSSWRDLLPVHPAADVFPLLPPDELVELAEDIKRNGLREPPTFWHDATHGWTLLDGRNRLDAAEMVGYQFQFSRGNPCRFWWAYLKPGRKTFTHCDVNMPRPEPGAAAIAVSANIRRRHLNPAERADLALQVIAASGGFVEHSTKPGRPQALAGKVAEIASVSKKTALEQIAVHADPALREAVKEKRLTPAQAAREARRQRKEKRLQADHRRMDERRTAEQARQIDVQTRLLRAALERCQRDPAALHDVLESLVVAFFRAPWPHDRCDQAEQIINNWADHDAVVEAAEVAL